MVLERYGVVPRKTEEEFKEKMKTIDIELKWVNLAPYLIRLIREGCPENRKYAEEEIMNMAKVMDWVRQAQKRGVQMLRVPSEKMLKEVV